MSGLTLAEAADRLGLALAGPEASARAALTVTGLAPLAEAGPGEVSFLANPKYARQLADTRALAVVCDVDHAASVPAALVSPMPEADFARLAQLFARPQGTHEQGVSPLAHVHPEALLGEGVTVMPYAYVGPRARIGAGTRLFPGVYVGEDVVMGEDCVAYPGAVVMAGTVMGARCCLQPGSVLGGEGFGFALGPQGFVKKPQLGNVVLGDDVELGANSAIDRGALGPTSVGSQTKIDNLVQLGHNVRVGQGCVLVAQVGIAGSTTVGDYVTMAGQAGVGGHIDIGDGVTIGPKTGVGQSIEAGKTVGGIPAMEKGVFFRTMAALPKLPELFKRVRALEKAQAKGPGSGDDNV